MKPLSYRIWPYIAAVLALLFISADILLVGEAREVQGRISHEVALLNELSNLGDAYNQLSTVHRVDVNTGSDNWPTELNKVKGRVGTIGRRFTDEPGIAELPHALAVLFHASDSLHSEVISRKSSPSDARMPEAVLQLMLQRSQKNVERTARLVHEQGLTAQTAHLSERWDQAQTLLFLASMMSVIFALLVGMNRRLLVESRSRSEQVQSAKKNLESINRELRETMMSKEEKEVMLKEIHHRVKNNLQIVRSLIRFQLDQVEDAHVQELFNECVNRVGAMALVHEQTYLSKDLANIDVSAYLDRLVRDLASAYNIRVKLAMDVDIQVKTLGVDTLIPLGLLINEIISNSFKYAFQGRENGTITVHLSGTEEGGLHLLIGDDGVGVQNRTAWEKPKSLGMELIHTLAEQLNGRVDLLQVPGTMYELSSVPLAVRKRA